MDLESHLTAAVKAIRTMMGATTPLEATPGGDKSKFDRSNRSGS